MKPTQKLRVVVEGCQFYLRYRDIVDAKVGKVALMLDAMPKADGKRTVQGIVEHVNGINIQVEYA
jgi:hypothetical protein